MCVETCTLGHPNMSSKAIWRSFNKLDHHAFPEFVAGQVAVLDIRVCVVSHAHGDPNNQQDLQHPHIADAQQK